MKLVRNNNVFFISKKVSILSAFLFLTLACQNKKQEKPNVLLILTDDQGWGDIGAHGNDTIQTPILDSLYSESVVFERFYVSPVWAQNRASLLTGRYHLRTGTSWVTHRKEVIRSEEVLISEIFKAEGYSTACFGKWHNGSDYPHNPQGQGFDEFLGFCSGHLNNYFNTELESNGKIIKTKVGFDIEVICDQKLITRQLDQEGEIIEINGQDRVHQGEVYEIIWNEFRFGKIKISKGQKTIELKLRNTKDENSFELKSLIF